MSTTFPEIHPATSASPDALDDLPVVLLHGGNVAGWMWEPQLEALQHRTVLTPDLPGFGRRTAEPWPGLGGAADDVVVRVERLTGSQRFHVVGLSLGGAVALHLAARHPDAAASVLVTGAPLLPVSGFHASPPPLQHHAHHLANRPHRRAGDFTEVVAILFDGGVLTSADINQLAPHPTEATALAFVPLDEAERLLDAELFARVRVALKAQHTAATTYLENGAPPHTT